MKHLRPRAPRLRGCLVLTWLLGVACSGAASPEADDLTSDQATAEVVAFPDPIGALGPLRVVGGTLVDGDDRQVLLHGTGLISLGDYYQGDPTLPAAPPLAGADWDAMAAYGFSAVRTVVSWSALEPTRGVYDQAAFARLADAIDDAAARGMYTVIDLHQDAWGKFIASPEGTTCGGTTEPAIGWDGAPEWATITDGASTCRPRGYREGSPAVRAAFKSFYTNRDGIADAFVLLWERLAEEFAGRPGVVGFDLLNEPNNVMSPTEMVPTYTSLMNRTIAAIREVEARKNVPSTPIFLEPVVLYPLPGNLPDPAGLGDPNRVFSPHIYPGLLTRDQMLDAAQKGADELAAPLWIGEFSFGDDSDAGLADIRGFMEALDDHRSGFSWWVWSTACGDPHYVQVPLVPPEGPHKTGVERHLKIVTCPEGTYELNRPFLELAGRSYPRVAPGRLVSLESDLVAGTMRVAAEDAPVGQTLVVWLLAGRGELPVVRESTGLGDPTITPFGEGAYLTAETTRARYSLSVGPAL